VLCWKTAEEAPMTKELRTILEALVTKQKSFEFSDFVPEVSKNGIFAPFVYKNEHFTKAGSGHT
jgi:hypothetical protein